MVIVLLALILMVLCIPGFGSVIDLFVSGILKTIWTIITAIFTSLIFLLKWALVLIPFIVIGWAYVNPESFFTVLAVLATFGIIAASIIYTTRFFEWMFKH